MMSRNPDKISREFEPGELEEALRGFDRRTFLKVMGAGLAMTGMLEGCAKPQPQEKIVPYVNQPEGLVPGGKLFYASALPLNGWGHGVVVEQHEGRPTKIEGNPDHPSSLGGTNVFMQAAVLDLYDPDRMKQVGFVNQVESWEGFLGAAREFVQKKGGAGNVRLRVLTGTETSPTLARLMGELKKTYPAMVWHTFDAAGRGNSGAGVARVYGRPLTPVYDFLQAKRIFSLDSHFLMEEPGSVRYAREFAHLRRVPFKKMGPVESLAKAVEMPRVTEEEMSRLYMVESTVTFTGARADHRLGLKSGEVAKIAALLADEGAGADLSDEVKRFVAVAREDLRKAGKHALVIAGEHQPAEVHAVAHAMNAALGAVGTTVRYVERVEVSPESGAETALNALVKAMRGGEVDVLLILGVNGVYAAPGELGFGEALRVFSMLKGYGTPERMAVYVGKHEDETAELCAWRVPVSHALESWGDVRGHDGTASVVQPLIEPLFGSKSAIEVVAGLIGVGAGRDGLLEVDGYELVRETWFENWGDVSAEEKEKRWHATLHDGVVTESAPATVQVTAGRDARAAAGELAGLIARKETGVELNFRVDPSVGTGEWANNGWLQELPKPLTRLTWDNAALMSPKMAERLGIVSAEDKEYEHKMRERHPYVEIAAASGKLKVPVWVQPGQPEDVVTVHVGYGRWRGGSVMQGVGVDVNPVRPVGAWRVAGVQVKNVGGEHTFACTQNTQVTAARDLVREREVGKLPGGAGIEDRGETPDLYSTEKDKDGGRVHLSLYDEFRYTGYKWGMVIDLSACIGCNACVVACQSENNIPVVGKEQVLRGREMHWIRIDAYYGEKETMTLGEASAGREMRMHFQPMLCQHCENAPCEVVCPVEATSHSDEGLNEMTYNRCVGTRYCSNNCPYKVRRFNFYQYNSHEQTPLNLQKNPNVTVRSRGVMEKCTYCVQRINEARINGKREWARNDAAGLPTEMRKPVVDGWLPGGAAEGLPRLRVVTACQQACPTEAIVFGDMNDAEALVYLLKTKKPWETVDYGVLTELNTQPRTSYLERIENSNPALRGGGMV